MKLSSFDTEQAFNIMCELAPYLSNIATDAELIAAVSRKIQLDEKTPLRLTLAGIEKMGELLPLLLKGHKEDLFHITAIVNQKSVQQVKEQNILVTMQELRELLRDEDLIGFFKSQAAPAKTL